MGTSLGYSIAIDIQGNIFTTGSFTGTVDFNPSAAVFTLTSDTSIYQNTFITKLDKFGNFVWAKKLGGSLNSVGAGIAIDGFGNIFVTGWLQGTGDFDPGTGVYNISTNGNNEDSYIIKLTNAGNFVWCHHFGSDSSVCKGNAICIDNANNVFMLANQDGLNVDYDPSSVIINVDNISNGLIVLKLDNSGNYKWVKNIDMGSTNRSITSDNNGNVVMVGNFGGNPTDFDPGPATYTIGSSFPEDAYILKLDSLGNFVFARDAWMVIKDVKTDANNDIYLTGNFWHMADFDFNAGNYTLNTPTLEYDIFVSKIRANSDFVWAKRIGGNLADEGNTLFVDNYKNVYSCGIFHGTVDFDPNAGIENLVDANQGSYMLKLDSLGQYEWARHFECNFNNIKVDFDENIYTTGIVFMNTDFDPDNSTFYVTNSSSTNTYNLKLRQCANTTIQSNANVLTAVAANATYQWVICPNYTLINGATNQNYTATANGSYACIVTQHDCADTTDCIAISGVATSNVEKENMVQLIPNPCSNTLYIKNAPSMQNKEFYMYNSIGQLLLSSNKNEIDVSHFCKGLYYIKVGNVTKTLIVE